MQSTKTERAIAAHADENLYPQVLRLLHGKKPGRTLDIPSGEGAFAYELIKKRFSNIVCLDINRQDFKLSGQVRFLAGDASDGLPFQAESFDYIFCLEGLEHFVSPFSFVAELGRVLRTGGWLYISTPNIMSVEARLRFMLTAYYPRFKPLMYNRESLRAEGLQGHISPIYFGQLKYFLEESRLRVVRIDTNATLFPDSFLKKCHHKLIAAAIRYTIRNRNFPDEGTLSDAMLYGDCIIIEAMKYGR